MWKLPFVPATMASHQNASLQTILAWSILLLGSSLEIRTSNASTTDNLAASQSDQPVVGTPETKGPSTEQIQPFIVSVAPYKAFISPAELREIAIFMKLNFEIGEIDAEVGKNYLSTPLGIPQRQGNVAFVDCFSISDNPISGITSSSIGVSSKEIEAVPWNREFDYSSPLDRESSSVLEGIALGGVNTRILIDGVPANDAFSGSQSWLLFPATGIAKLEAVPGGGATAWGEGALGGVVQVFMQPPDGRLVSVQGSLTPDGPPQADLQKQVVSGTGEVTAEDGSFGTRDFTIYSAQPIGFGALQFIGEAYSTEGFPLISPSMRGLVDRSAWNRHEMFQLRWRQMLGKKIIATATIKEGWESHDYGTDFQQGNSDGQFASIALTSHTPGSFAWTANAYVQSDQAMEGFSIVDESRDQETPDIKQFAKPVTSFGANLTGNWWQEDGSNISAAIDYRSTNGEARVGYDLREDDFTREVLAGGSQGDFGAYVIRNERIGDTLDLVLGARIDYWSDSNGHQDLVALTGGIESSIDRFRSSNGIEVSPSVGLSWRPKSAWKITLNAQQSFSRPSLANLYQPSAIYSTVVEPNDSLAIEHCTSFNFGTDYKIHLGALPTDNSSTLTISVTAFSNSIHDAIGLEAMHQGNTPIEFFGQLPTGYLVEKYLNLDSVRSDGGTVSAAWSLNKHFELSLFAKLVDATIERAAAPDLLGKQLANVPRADGGLKARWRATRNTSFIARVRFTGSSFVDDENTLRLASATVADLGVEYSLNSTTHLTVSVDNLADAPHEISRGTSGVFYFGSPRFFDAGVHFSW